MTLVELQEILGKQISDITDERIPFENRRKVAETALVVSSLAKQMINNADVVLRSVKFMSDYKLDGEVSQVKDMVMGKYALAAKKEDGSLEVKDL